VAKASNYYYDQLNKEQQRAYYAIKEGLGVEQLEMEEANEGEKA